MLQEFCETTSFHGFPDFYKSGHWACKMFWLIVIIASCLTTAYFIYTATDGFADAPLTTSSRQVVQPVLELPEIAICPSARLNTTKMELLYSHE